MKIPSQESIKKKTSVANRKLEGIAKNTYRREKYGIREYQGEKYRSKGALDSDFCGQISLSIQETVCEQMLCKSMSRD